MDIEVVETRLNPEFWVAVVAGIAGLPALFVDRASQRRRQGESQSVEREPA